MLPVMSSHTSVISHPSLFHIVIPDSQDGHLLENVERCGNSKVIGRSLLNVKVGEMCFLHVVCYRVSYDVHVSCHCSKMTVSLR